MKVFYHLSSARMGSAVLQGVFCPECTLFTRVCSRLFQSSLLSAVLSDGGGTHDLSCAVDMETEAQSGALSLPSPRPPWSMGLFMQEYCRGLPFPCYPGESEVKVPACNTGDLGSIPGLGRSPGEGIGYPLHYFCLQNSMDRGAWWAAV